MLAGSSYRAEWKCPTCCHEWQAPVVQRVIHDSGCPRCNKNGGNNNTQPTFVQRNTLCCLRWDFERNSKDGMYPSNITLGSQKMVHWVCHKCPEGQLHLYQMTPNDCTNRQRAGCPCCVGMQVCECNSLQTRYPMISSAGDFARNDMTPAHVTS